MSSAAIGLLAQKALWTKCLIVVDGLFKTCLVAASCAHTAVKEFDVLGKKSIYSQSFRAFIRCFLLPLGYVFASVSSGFYTLSTGLTKTTTNFIYNKEKV